MEILSLNDDVDDSRAKKQIITAIKPAVKNENRVNVFVDKVFAFSLDIAQLVDEKLKQGQVLTDVELNRLKKISNFGKLYQRTLEWVLTRPRSVRETRDYLRRKQKQKPDYKIEDEAIDGVVERLVTKGYLDDEKFAEYYAENRFVNKGVSVKRLKMELMKKGVDMTIIEKVLAESGRDEVAEIRKMIAKKRARYTDEQLIQYLVRQGFSFELARNEVHGTD